VPGQGRASALCFFLGLLQAMLSAPYYIPGARAEAIWRFPVALAWVSARRMPAVAAVISYHRDDARLVLPCPSNRHRARDPSSLPRSMAPSSATTTRTAGAHCCNVAGGDPLALDPPRPLWTALDVAMLAGHGNGHRASEDRANLTMVVCRPRAPPSPQSHAERGPAKLPDRPLLARAHSACRRRAVRARPLGQGGLEGWKVGRQILSALHEAKTSHPHTSRISEIYGCTVRSLPGTMEHLCQVPVTGALAALARLGEYLVQ
jgi:hypothetical protein